MRVVHSTTVNLHIGGTIRIRQREDLTDLPVATQMKVAISLLAEDMKNKGWFE